MPPRHPELLLAAALLGLAAAIASIGAAAAQPLGETVSAAAAGERFGILGWEARTAFNRWLAIAAETLGMDGAAADGEAVERYFATGSNRFENGAERAIERGIARTASRRGLDRPLPLFKSQRIVWPPVDIELSRSPRILVVSPRGEIDFAGGRLLDPDLPIERYGEIEAAVERGGDWSAWVGGIGGIALYPAIVLPRADAAATIRIAAHEWIHHYLAFYPLGIRYGRSADLRTLNETIADIAGDELGSDVAAELGLAPAGDGRDASPALDEAYAMLRRLRLDVDAMLAGGEVERAEALMESTRLDLWELGYRARRINQAFFAFRGSYADAPGSTDPIGEELLELRARSADLAAFMAIVRGFTGRGDLAGALAATD